MAEHRESGSRRSRRVELILLSACVLFAGGLRAGDPDGPDDPKRLDADALPHLEPPHGGGELVCSSIPNALEGFAASFFEEHDLGGVELSLDAGWGF